MAEDGTGKESKDADEKKSSRFSIKITGKNVLKPKTNILRSGKKESKPLVLPPKEPSFLLRKKIGSKDSKEKDSKDTVGGGPAPLDVFLSIGSTSKSDAGKCLPVIKEKAIDEAFRGKGDDPIAKEMELEVTTQAEKETVATTVKQMGPLSEEAMAATTATAATAATTAAAATAATTAAAAVTTAAAAATTAAAAAATLSTTPATTLTTTPAAATAVTKQNATPETSGDCDKFKPTPPPDVAAKVAVGGSKSGTSKPAEATKGASDLYSIFLGGTHQQALSDIPLPPPLSKTAATKPSGEDKTVDPMGTDEVVTVEAMTKATEAVDDSTTGTTAKTSEVVGEAVSRVTAAPVVTEAKGAAFKETAVKMTETTETAVGTKVTGTTETGAPKVTDAAERVVSMATEATEMEAARVTEATKVVVEDKEEKSQQVTEATEQAGLETRAPKETFEELTEEVLCKVVKAEGEEETVSGTAQARGEAVPEVPQITKEVLQIAKTVGEAIPEATQDTEKTVPDVMQVTGEAVSGVTQTTQEAVPEMTRTIREAVPGMIQPKEEAFSAIDLASREDVVKPSFADAAAPDTLGPVKSAEEQFTVEEQGNVEGNFRTS